MSPFVVGLVARIGAGDGDRCAPSPAAARARAEAKPDTAPVSRREKGPKMLSAARGMLAIPPVVFGVARYAMVPR